MSELSGPYHGRLSYDPDSDFHTDLDGYPVVTDDAGQSWRYATDGDVSHNARYHERHVTVDSTANRLVELQLEHGREKAAQLIRDDQPHHFSDEETLQLRSHPDSSAPTVTSHTDAWTE